MPNDANKLTKTAYPQPQMPQLAPPVLWPVAEVSFRIRQDCLVYQGNPMLLKSHESPRHQGRNRRGRGGSARKRQLDKRNRAFDATITTTRASSQLSIFSAGAS
jgi:hypothetical protein